MSRERNRLISTDRIASSVYIEGGDLTPGTGATSLGKAEDAAHTSGDVGVMMLAVRNDTLSTIPTNTDRDYAAISVSDRGSLYVQLAGGAISDAATVIIGSSLTNGGTAGQLLGAGTLLWDGAAWNRQRNNLEGTALASAARTATVNSSDIVNYNGRGVIVFLDVTVASGTGGLTISIEEKDPVSGAYHQVQSGHGPYTTTGQRRAVYYPGASATLAAETVANLATVISRTFRIAISHNDGSSYTYSVGYAIIL